MKRCDAILWLVVIGIIALTVLLAGYLDSTMLADPIPTQPIEYQQQEEQNK